MIIIKLVQAKPKFATTSFKQKLERAGIAISQLMNNQAYMHKLLKTALDTSLHDSEKERLAGKSTLIGEKRYEEESTESGEGIIETIVYTWKGQLNEDEREGVKKLSDKLHATIRRLIKNDKKLKKVVGGLGKVFGMKKLESGILATDAIELLWAHGIILSVEVLA